VPKKNLRQAENRAPKSDSRKELIDVALKIIINDGIDALRIDDVCEKVGVTKGSLYWHFQDREGLVRAALFEQLRQLSETQLASLDAAIENATSRDEYLVKVAGSLANPFDTNESENRWERWEMLARARRDPELKQFMTEIQKRYQHFLTSVMTKAKDRGVLRGDVDPAAVAAAITALALGSNHLSYLGDEGPTQSAWNDLMLKMTDMLFPTK
jgi:AcrR family transcriptional regulator